MCVAVFVLCLGFSVLGGRGFACLFGFGCLGVWVLVRLRLCEFVDVFVCLWVCGFVWLRVFLCISMYL